MINKYNLNSIQTRGNKMRLRRIPGQFSIPLPEIKKFNQDSKAFQKNYGVDTPIIELGRIPHQDSMSFIDGRLVLETGDILKIKGDFLNTQKCIVSVLENAK